MAKKLYTEVGGVSHKVKKLYTEVGGVSRKVKKLYAEVGGYSKLVFNGAQPLIYSFSTYAHNSTSLNQIFEMSSWSAGYGADGSIELVANGHNKSSSTDIGAPAAKVTMDFAEDLTGKTITFFYDQRFDNDKTYNNFWMYITKNGATTIKGFTSGYGYDRTYNHVVEAGTTSLAIVIIAGAEGYSGGGVSIKSIKVDGEEVLK